MSIIVDLYEILVRRGTPKKKAGGSADAPRPAQCLVIKEDALAACRTFGVSPLFSTTAFFSPKP